jgi:tetratricopeptide (TPR) repeat protein
MRKQIIRLLGSLKLLEMAIRVTENWNIQPESDPIILDLAIEYNKKHGRIEKVINLLIHKSDSSDEEIKHLAIWDLCHILINLEKYEEALPYILQSIKIWENESQPYTFAGIAYQNLKNLSAAETYYNKALEIFSANPDAVSGLLDILFKKNRIIELKNFLSDYIKKFPKLSAGYYLLGEFNIQIEGYPCGSIANYQKALEVYQNNFEYNQEFQKQYFLMANFPRDIIWDYSIALLDCKLYEGAEKLAIVNFSKREYLNWKGNILLHTKNYDLAEKYILDAIKGDKQNKRLFSNLAYLYLMTGRYSESAEWYEKSFKLVRFKTEVSEKVNYGIALEKAGEKEKALEQIRVSIAQDEDAYLFTKAYTLWDLGEWQEVINISKKILEKNDSVPKIQFQMARSFIEIGDLEQGIIELTKLVETQPMNYEIWLFLGDAYSRSYSYDKAIFSVEKGLEIDGNSEIINKLLTEKLNEINQKRYEK